MKLSSKMSRNRLPARDKPYFESIPGTGVQLGYRTGSQTWLVRWWDNGRGVQRSLKAYADNWTPADGSRILNFKQAVKAALKRAAGEGNFELEKLTVGQVFGRYASSRDSVGKDTRGSWAQYRKWIKPDFHTRRVSSLKKAELVAWRDGVAKSVKPATVNRILAIFKACLKFGLEELEIPFIGLPIWKSLKSLEVINKGGRTCFNVSEATAYRIVNGENPPPIIVLNGRKRVAIGAPAYRKWLDCRTTVTVD